MDLAEEVRLHFTYVSSVERGERNISLQNIVRLAQGLGGDLGRWYEDWPRSNRQNEGLLASTYPRHVATSSG